MTEIEVHEVRLTPQPWAEGPLKHYFSDGTARRTVYIAHTDTGLEGYGEGPAESGPAEQSVIDSYIGTNPFQHIGDVTSLGIGTAMYDLMGKAAGVPVWQLIGQQQRKRVPVSAWFVSSPPEKRYGLRDGRTPRMEPASWRCSCLIRRWWSRC